MRNRTASGTIFIVDISGYSKFVMKISTEEGATIMPILLKSVLRANDLTLRGAEIEGDAVLFYRMGKAISIDRILSQFRKMMDAFHSETEILKQKHPELNDLTIKAVVHYGELSGFAIEGFYQLYGSVLIEAHRLLKYHIHSHSYVLITEAYNNEQEVAVSKGKESCDYYDVGNICYTYFSYQTSVQSSKWLV